VGPSGELHALFRDGTGALLYSRRPGPWDAPEAVTPPGTTIQARAGLAIGADGSVYVGYATRSPEQIYVAERGTDGIWNRTLVEVDPDVGGATAVAVDSAGTVHVASLERNAADVVHFASRAPGSVAFIRAPIAAAGDPRDAIDVIVDGEERPHVAYFDRSAGGVVKLVSINGAEQTMRDVATVGTGNPALSLARDVDGLVHLAYHNDALNAVSHAVLRLGRLWVEPVRTHGNHGELVGMACGADGYCHIAYSVGGRLGISHNRADSFWRIERLGAAGGAGQEPSVAVAPGDHVYVAFRAPDGSLALANRLDGGPWDFATLDPGPVADPELIVGPGGTSVAVAYQGNDEFRWIEDVSSSSIVALILDDEPGSGRWPTGVTTDDGRVHLAYAAAGELRYLTRAPGSIEFDPVEVAASDRTSGAFASMVVLGDVPVVAYQESSRQDLFVATREPSWASELVDEIDDVGSFASLISTHGTSLYVAHFDSTLVTDSTGAVIRRNEDLLFATRFDATAAWTRTAIDTAGDVGRHASLSADDRRRLVVAYHWQDPRDLLLAWRCE